MRILHTAARKWRWGVALAAATAIGVAVAGQGNAAPAPAKRFDAVQLTDAVLFNNGPAAPNLASLQRGQVPWTDAMAESQQAVDRAVAADPKWAASFAGRIQSGDPNQIESALGDLGKLAYSALVRQFGSDAITRAVNIVGCLIDERHLILGQDLATEFANYAGDVLWVDNDVVIYAEIAAAAVAVVFAAVVFEKPDCVGALKQELLAQEVVVRGIATGLRAAVG